MKRKLSAARGEGGIPALLLHDLRRTAAKLVESGRAIESQ
jgi:hypothetical protein